MNGTRMWLALAAAAWFVLRAAAAPAPTPPSQGPISDALALRGVLGKTAPPTLSTAVVVEKGVIETECALAIPVSKEVVETVTLPNGKQEQVARVVTETVYETRTVRLMVDGLKFYTVTAEGKLEAIDAAKATGMLKQKTPVLTGATADVDPRNLELVKPGTLYLVVPLPQTDVLPRLPPAPDGKRI